MAQHRDTTTERVARAYARIEDVQRKEVWITLRPAAQAVADAAAVADRLAAGARLPLAGLTLAVKDNIDVAGLPTTAACPRYSFAPQHSAPAVARLTDAGAVVLGKTNLDQFATGLAGTRSPHGAVRDARRTEFVSGGSSSGSAVAVALGIADIGLGTDTAGSVRVPAAFQGLIGIKPTIGLITTQGVVPANRSLDCVGVLTRELGLGRRVLELLAVTPPRAWPRDAPLAAPQRARVGVPAQLPELSQEAIERFGDATQRLRAAGNELVEIDFSPFLEAGAMLYGASFMAERHAAVGEFISRHPGRVDPTVAHIILAAGGYLAHAYVSDTGRLAELRARACAEMAGIDAVLAPTTVRQPRIEELQADPIDANRPLGLYSTAANLLDLCAIAVPAGEADDGQFGVTLMGRAFADALVCDLAADLLGEARAGRPLPSAPVLEIVVQGGVAVDLRAHGAVPGPGHEHHHRWLLAPAALEALLASLPTNVALRRRPGGDGADALTLVSAAT